MITLPIVKNTQDSGDFSNTKNIPIVTNTETTIPAKSRAMVSIDLMMMPVNIPVNADREAIMNMYLRTSGSN